MYERKKHVIVKAHQLFIEKGFRATSIQDILDHSGISKGTFYNYFPSKSELFKAVLLNIQENYEKERNELLLGESPEDIEIFVKQLDLMMQSNRKNKLLILIEEVIFSNDQDLKKFIQEIQMMYVNWIHNRFVDLFGKEKSPYLLDCTILFFGMLHQMLRYNFMDNGPKYQGIEIIRYCMDRVQQIVKDVSKSDVQLLNPDILKEWLSQTTDHTNDFFDELVHLSEELKKEIVQMIHKETDKIKYIQTVDFILDEIRGSKVPRLFLIESLLVFLKKCSELKKTKVFEDYQRLIEKYVLV
ncbi:TetR/AcrR family transcriptional regulator [Heyndrickxia sp. FSL W8-0496]|uniref:TetR/AcrR family transcriptional regulator n=1 Tax=Heyndrickxia TaxID=2837504 RepID=UPI0030FAD65A